MVQATARTLHSALPSAKSRFTPLAERTAEIISGIFPDTNSGARATHRYFATFLTVVSAAGFLVLLGINTLLAQDAFTLANLKVEAKQVADQRDAINRAIDSFEAPENLAAAAIALGMRPSETPVFLNLEPTRNVTNG
jgi:hypothetical protein